MITISTTKIKNAIRDAFVEICTNLDRDVYDSIKKVEPSNDLEKFALDTLVENAEIAYRDCVPVCQDTGMAVIFLEIGQNVCLVDSYINDAVNLGVEEAYINMRKSVVDPLTRINTKLNTPAVIHTKIVKGDAVTVDCIAKGFGSENMSKVFMLTPADGTQGIINKVVETVKEAGCCPCPPIIVGIGIGGTMEKAALLSKHALLRPISDKNDDPSLELLEKQILNEINSLYIGASGFGGDTTALKVSIETFPTHIAGLPLAINIQCHCSRHKKIVIGEDND